MSRFAGTPKPGSLFRSLRADPSYTIPGALALGVATALVVAFLSLVRWEAFSLVPELVLQLPGEADWGLAPGPAAASPAEIAGAKLTGLLGLAGAVTALAVAAGVLTWTLLSLGRESRLRGERGVRRALGASRTSLLAHAAAESLALALPALAGGAAAGAVLGALGRWMWPGVVETGPMLTPVEWGAAASVAAAAVGLRTMLTLGFLASETILTALGDGGRLTATRREVAVRNGLAVLQLGLALAILTGAGLLIRGTHSGAEQARPVGADDVVTAHLTAADGAHPDSVERRRFYRTLLRSAAELTTVEAESIASVGAWQGLGREERVMAQCGACTSGGLPMPFKSPVVREHSVTPGFFRTMGLEVLSGRGFRAEDAEGSTPVAVVSRSFAQASFENGDPLGRQVQVAGLEGPWLTVVGVVQDLAPPGPGNAGEPAPTLYLSAFQHPPREAGLALRFGESPEGGIAEDGPAEDGQALVESLVLEAGNGRWVVAEVATLGEVLAEYRAPLVWLAWLFALLGATTLVLSLHGLYAVSRYRVQSQLRELAVRMALGATPRAIVRLVLLESTRLAVWGGVTGVWCALFVGGTLQAFGLPMFDAGVTGGGLGLLLAAALLGSLGPAREAGRSRPARALAGR